MILNTTQIDHGQTDPLTTKEVKEIRDVMKLRELREAEFSPENLREYMELIHIMEPDKVYRQAVLETGNFTSAIFRENQNIFGMKMPHTRISTAKGERRGHAWYRHWTDSVEDYLHWQEFYFDNGWDMSDYYSFLKQIPYAEDPKYTEKLQGI